MRGVSTVLLALICSFLSPVFSQNVSGGEQILVFLRSGETIMFHPDELKIVELVDSVSPEGVKSMMQRFVSEDGMVEFPIVDIDSVTFGNRNSVIPKQGVRRLTDIEVRYIEDFDGESITFKAEAPVSAVPTPGEKIYYDRFTGVFPYGLCGRVVSSSESGGKHILMFEEMDAAEMFDKYLFTADEAPLFEVSRADAELSWNVDEEFRFNRDDLYLYQKVASPVTLKFNDVVTDLVNHYYHAKISLHVTPELVLRVLNEGENHKDKPYEKESDILFHRTIPLYGNTLSVSFDLQMFIELAAELGIEIDMTDDIFIEFEWTRHNGVNDFSQPVINILSEGNTVRQEIHLDGSVFLGPQLNLRIGTLFNRVGVGAQFRTGPKLTAEFSLGMIYELSERFDWDLYAKGKIDWFWNTEMTTYSYVQGFFQDPISIELPFNAVFETEHHTWNLFPEFHSRAVVGNSTMTDSSERALGVATYTATDLEYPLPIGFSIADEGTETVISETIEYESNIAESHVEEPQIFADEFPLVGELKNIDTDKIVVQPVFKYKDRIIKAESVPVRDDATISPVIYSGSTVNSYIVSGSPVVSQKTENGTTFIEGNYLPTGWKNDVIASGLRRWRSESVENLTFENLRGTWNGIVKGRSTQLVFSDSGTGTYDGRAFTYSLGSLYNGLMDIRFTDGSRMSFIVKSVDGDTMRLSVGNTTAIYILTRN